MTDASQLWTPADSFQELNTQTILARLVDEALEERGKAESRFYHFLRDYHAAQIVAFAAGDHEYLGFERAETGLNLWLDLLRCRARWLTLTNCDISKFQEQILDYPQAEALMNELVRVMSVLKGFKPDGSEL